MKYRLKGHFSKEPEQALLDILSDRGVKDIESFVRPTSENENSAYDLDNIEEAAEKLLYHLQEDNDIAIVVD